MFYIYGWKIMSQDDKREMGGGEAERPTFHNQGYLKIGYE